MTSRKTSYSPIQRFRRVSHEEENNKLPITFKITLETIPAFELVKHRIYPILKPSAWIKKARDAFLLCNDGKPTLLIKSISNINLGFLYAYIEEDCLYYITSLHLIAWSLNEKEMKQLCIANLTKYVDEIERPLFNELQIGMYYCNKLKMLTSSLLCIPSVLDELPIKTNNLVLMVPSSNLMLIGQPNDQKSLTFMGDFNIKCTNKVMLCNKPIRCTKHNLSFYEPSMVKDEYIVPSTYEQLKTSKKSVLKKSFK